MYSRIRIWLTMKKKKKGNIHKLFENRNFIKFYFFQLNNVHLYFILFLGIPRLTNHTRRNINHDSKHVLDSWNRITRRRRRCFRISECLTFWPIRRSHDVGSSSWNIDGMVVGDIRQYSAAAVALGAAFHRIPTEFPDTVAQKNVLHSDRIYMTKSSSSIDFVS